MSKSNAFENDLLKLVFNGTPIPNLADNAAASPLTSLYMALHTADPGEDGNQSTSEVTYTGYSRIAINRSTAGWTVTGNSVSPVNPVEWGEMTAGVPSEALYASVGIASAGGGKILYKGSLTPSVKIDIGVVPRLRTTSTITEE